MAGSAGGESGQEDSGAAVPGSCSAGHTRPARLRGGWMCARCGLRIMPLTAPECFEGHGRPRDVEPWTLWVCPEDGELVVPPDISWYGMANANQSHPFLAKEVRLLRRDDFDPTEIDRSRAVPVIVRSAPDQRRLRGDPNDSLITIAAPILAGFSLAAIVSIGLSASASNRPEALPAMAFFAGASVLLLFSIQMLAVAALPGFQTAPGFRKAYKFLKTPALQENPWPRLVKDFLYEMGLLAFLVGLGLFLWTRSWSAAAIAGVAVVGLAAVSDLALLVTSWLRPDWGRPRLGR